MRTRIAAWLLAGATLTAGLDGAARADELRLAQAGSYGGSIGKQDKSVSGEETAPRAAPHRAPAREPRRQGGNDGGNFDGTWTVQSTGQNCSINTSVAFIVQGRRIIGQGGAGTVSASGAVAGVASIGSLSVTSRGQLSGRSGYGTFSQSDGCVGRWVAVRK